MSYKAKTGASFVVLVILLLMAPAAQADPIQVVTNANGFQLLGMGNNGHGTTNPNFDACSDGAHSDLMWWFEGAAYAFLNQCSSLRLHGALAPVPSHSISRSCLPSRPHADSVTSHLISLRPGYDSHHAVDPLPLSFDISRWLRRYAATLPP